MKGRSVLPVLALLFLGQGMLAAQAAEEAKLTWTFEADYTVDGMPRSCNETFANTWTCGQLGIEFRLPVPLAGFGMKRGDFAISARSVNTIAVAGRP